MRLMAVLSINAGPTCFFERGGDLMTPTALTVLITLITLIVPTMTIILTTSNTDIGLLHPLLDQVIR